MKKKTQNISQDFKMPHLFREDLEELEDILKEASVQEYKLESQSFEYKEVKEIPEDLDTINEFHIQTYSPYISIDLNHHSARIYAEENDLKTIGVVKKIITVISRRERKVLYWFSKLSTWFAPILFFSPIQVLLEVGKEEKKLSFNNMWWLLIILLPIIAAIWWIIGCNNILKKFSVVEFAYRKNRLSFFVRNKDQIILITIGALLGALATIFFQKIFK